MRKILNDEMLQEELLQKGYVKISLLDKTTVDELAAEINQLKPDDGFDPNGKAEYLGAYYHCTFIDSNIQYKKEVDKLVRKYFEQKLKEVLCDYKILTANFYVKMPGKGEFEIHQNWTTSANLKDTTLTAWCPMVDCTKENGTLEVVPYSHKLTPDIACLSNIEFFNSFKTALKEKWLVPINCEAGECIIFDDSIIHYTDANKSNIIRTTVQIETIPNEVSPVLYYCDRDNPNADLEMFEATTDFFLNHTVLSLATRPGFLKSLGTVKNPNKEITEVEFADLLMQKKL